jgi:hypothetical protein
MADISKIQIQDGVYNIKDQIARTEIQKIQQANKKYIFLGDSYGTGQNELGEQSTPWTTLVPQYLGLTAQNYITNSSNGSGFKNGKTFLVQLQEVEQTITNKNEITDIVIVGGYNDKNYTVTEILASMNTFFSYAKTTFPKADLKLGCVGWSRNYNVRQSISNRSLVAYTQCGSFGCQYLHNTQYILHDYSLFSNDKYHPNQNGQNELSKYLTEAILSGSCNVVRGFITPTYNASSNVTKYDLGYILESQVNENIYLMANIGFLKTTAQNLGNRTVVPLIEFSDGLILGSGLPIFRQYMQMFCGKTDNTFDKLMGSITVQYNENLDKGILCFINQADNLTHSNINAFNTDVICLTIPALYC